jgi:hypothetical protein
LIIKIHGSLVKVLFVTKVTVKRVGRAFWHLLLSAGGQVIFQSGSMVKRHKMRKVVIVENYAPFRMRLASLLSAEMDIELVGQIESLADGFSVIQQKKPDLVILNPKLLDGIGIEEFRFMMSAYPPARAMFISC